MEKFALAALLVFILITALMGRHSIDDLEKAIYVFRRGHDGGLLYIRFRFTTRALELRKYINSAEDYGITLCFPRKKWTQPYFDEVERLCKQLGFDCFVEEATFGRPLAREYLIADFGGDFSAADRVCENNPCRNYRSRRKL